MDKFGCHDRAAGGWVVPHEFACWAPSNNIIVVIVEVLRATFTEGLYLPTYMVGTG